MTRLGFAAAPREDEASLDWMLILITAVIAYAAFRGTDQQTKGKRK